MSEDICAYCKKPSDTGISICEKCNEALSEVRDANLERDSEWAFEV